MKKSKERWPEVEARRAATAARPCARLSGEGGRVRLQAADRVSRKNVGRPLIFSVKKGRRRRKKK
jgi:hypothetical protein